MSPAIAMTNDGMELWIIATLAAAGFQTARFMLQKQLKTAGLSTGGATFSRFVFAAPLAAGLALVLVERSGTAIPAMPARFWIFALAGGLSQILATLATVALFAQRNFAVGIAFTKTETVLTALFALIILGEGISTWGVIAILLGLVGLIVLSRPPGTVVAGWRIWNKASGLGLMAGAGFGISAIGYRGATQALDSGDFLLRAALTLAVVTAAQTLAMVLWLRVREPGQVAKVLAHWRRTTLVGVAGMLGSLGWFIAFTLQHAAYVRALGQIELIFSIFVSTLIFHEPLRGRETAGIALIALSIVMIVLLA